MKSKGPKNFAKNSGKSEALNEVISQKLNSKFQVIGFFDKIEINAGVV